MLALGLAFNVAALAQHAGGGALLMEPASYEEAKARIEEEGITTYRRHGDAPCLYFDDPDGHGLQLLYLGHD